MPVDGSDDRAAGDDDFIAEYDRATEADVIEDTEPERDIEDAELERDTEDTDDGAVAGSFAPEVAVTPQSPTPENVLFVAIGINLTLLAFAEMIPGLGIAPGTAAMVTVTVAAVTALCYGILIKTTPDT